MAQEVMGDIITTQVEAYIQDKAAQYSVTVAVDVQLNSEGLPTAVTVTGDVPPAIRNGLAEMMEQELGIEKEAQQWESG